MQAVYRVENLSKGVVLAGDVRLAASFLSRAWGLLGRRGLESGEALLIRPCNSVHTFFMRFPIDVLFMNRAGRALKLVPGLVPWRVAACPGAHTALELPEGVLAASGTCSGDMMTTVEVKQRADNGRLDETVT